MRTTAPLAHRVLSLWGVAPPNVKLCACGHPRGSHKAVWHPATRTTSHDGPCTDSRCAGCSRFSEVSQ